MGQRQEVLDVLEDLLRLEDVKACMVAKRGLKGITPEANEIEDIDLWKLIKKTTDDFFQIIKKFYDYDLATVQSEIEEYTIYLSVLDENTALVVIFPSLANKGLVEVEIENSRRKLLEIYGENK